MRMDVNSSQESLLAPLIPKSDDLAADEMGTDPETRSDHKRGDSIQEIENTSGDDNHSIEGRLLLDHERVVAERKLVRKLDTRLLPCIVVIFIMNYVRPLTLLHNLILR
jgi:hypothetical protein